MSARILIVTQLASAVLLVICILLQQRGEGLSGGLVGTALEYSTKRGVEKIVFVATIILAVAFLASYLARLVVGA